MNIIVLTKKWRSPLNIRLTGATLGLAIGAFTLSLILVVSAGYFIGTSKSGQSFSLFSASLQSDLTGQQQTASQAARAAQDNVNVLTARLAQLQAHVIRLDALGRRLVEMAKLDKGEFDFGRSPPQGGPEIPSYTEFTNIPKFAKTLSHFSGQLEDKEQQLGILETLMMTRNLQQQVVPTSWPVSKTAWISSHYGQRTDPFSGRLAMHHGIDFAAKEGSTVVAAGAGVVTWSSERFGYGNMVEVDHGNGIATRYGHNKKNVVKVGDIVKKGQTVAFMGSSGRSTGPHVHFEVLRDGKPVNPAIYVSTRR